MSKLPIKNFYETEKTAEMLNTLIATFVDFYYLYKDYHWNYQGSKFYQYHTLFDKHATTIYESQDVVAERIRQLGEVTQGQLLKYPELSKLDTKRTNEVHEKNLPSILTSLVSAHDQTIELLETIITYSSDQNDFSTADLLTKFLEDHQQMRWFIVASQSE